MLLDRRWIEEHIPHKHGMCLLDEVLSWDATQTRCRASTHRSLDNPLRAHGRLGSACGIEYAAQTMAVHGALVASAAGGIAPPGLLASVRGVRLNIDRLDVFDADLVTLVKRVAGDESTALYEFSVSADDLVLVIGRAAIAFDVFAGVSNVVLRSADGIGAELAAAELGNARALPQAAAGLTHMSPVPPGAAGLTGAGGEAPAAAAGLNQAGSALGAETEPKGAEAAPAEAAPAEAGGSPSAPAGAAGLTHGNATTAGTADRSLAGTPPTTPAGPDPETP